MEPKKILVVDDEPDIRLTISTLLVANGFLVREAEDGRTCLGLLQEQDFDLMILDLLMPGLDGREVLKRIPAETATSTPIIVLTALGADKDILEGYALGATMYLTKPFDNNMLLDTVKYLVADLSQEERIELERRL